MSNDTPSSNYWPHPRVAVQNSPRWFRKQVDKIGRRGPTEEEIRLFGDAVKIHLPLKAEKPHG